MKTPPALSQDATIRTATKNPINEYSEGGYIVKPPFFLCSHICILFLAMYFVLWILQLPQFPTVFEVRV